MNENCQQSYSPRDMRLDEEKKAVVVQYMPLVKFIAQRIRDRLPSHILLEDLEHAGMLGLMEAVCRFEPSSHNTFKTYAEHRIRGAILDDLRKNDWMTRTGREKYKLWEQTVRGLEKKYQREVTAQEIADVLGMKMDAYFDFLGDAKMGVFLSLEDIVQNKKYKEMPDSEQMTAPERQVWVEQVKLMLTEEIGKLKLDEQLVLSLYYFEELTLKEIGQVMERTESRICQIHNEVMATLTRRLKRRVER
jgi:RNA polymerase sigma factor for flagellar operon FliA